MTGPTPPPDPPAAGRPPWAYAAAVACWLVGAHATIVPGVVGFTIYALGSEEGWGNVLGSGAGMVLVLIFGASLGSSLALIAAGFGLHRGRYRRAGRAVGAAVGLAAVAAGLMFSR